MHALKSNYMNRRVFSDKNFVFFNPGLRYFYIFWGPDGEHAHKSSGRGPVRRHFWKDPQRDGRHC